VRRENCRMVQFQLFAVVQTARLRFDRVRQFEDQTRCLPSNLPEAAERDSPVPSTGQPSRRSRSQRVGSPSETVAETTAELSA
jgi:hypothetical protein